MDVSDIARMMGELLEIEDMSEDENFFSVGGNSLLALSLISEMLRQSGVRISLLELFRNPTPRDLSELVSQRSQAVT